jgi:2-dehydro-3-deoxyphosphogluconate aldolase/(4S)-4-hydroxy-2-oxoglutarate aldolase
VVLGVGSVRTPRQAEEAAAAGAGFLVSPVFLDWMPAAAPPGVSLLPGALTPTEVVRAWESGAVAAVKLFPAGASGGAAYVAQVVAPLPDVPLLPTGGIELEEVPRYLGAGAVGVGLGGPLLGDALRPGGDLEALRRRAEGLVSSLRP